MFWWLWMLFGLGLMVFEVLTPGGFYVFFFGVGALLVGVLTGLGLGGPDWLQWLLFSILSVTSLLLFRNSLLRILQTRNSDPSLPDPLVGATVILLEDLNPGAVGRAEVSGSTWAVLNEDSAILHKGQRCRVRLVEGLTLRIRAT
jgi:membrane protein implicated in regulation of membrane protease activity